MKKTIFALLCMMILASHAALAQTSYAEKLAKAVGVQAKQQRSAGSYSSLNNVAQNREEIKAFQKMNKELPKQ